MFEFFGTFCRWPLSYIFEGGPGAASSEPSDDELARRFRTGNDDAFDALVRRFQDRMYNLAFRMVNNREEACDLTQEIFIRLHRKIGSFRGESAFGTWLHSLAINLCRTRLARLRLRGTREALSLDDKDPDNPEHRDRLAPDCKPTPDAAVAGRDMIAVVESCIAELTAEYREVMVLRDIQGLEYEEIATALDLALGTVKSRLARARLQVKDKLVRMGIV